jgi:hypothetical protein
MREYIYLFMMKKEKKRQGGREREREIYEKAAVPGRNGNGDGKG